jgi:hypothetical protein
MKAQWSLQKQIVNRTRSLGMVGQLPAFQAVSARFSLILIPLQNCLRTPELQWQSRGKR